MYCERVSIKIQLRYRSKIARNMDFIPNLIVLLSDNPFPSIYTDNSNNARSIIIPDFTILYYDS